MKDNTKYNLYSHTITSAADSTHIPLAEGFRLVKRPVTLKLFLHKKVDLKTYIYSLFSYKNFYLYQIYDRDGMCAHHSTVCGKTMRYTFMKDNEYMINQCTTAEKYRGQGLYPYVLTQIMLDNIGKKHYIYITHENISSQNGVKKAGFEHCGFIERKHPNVPGIFHKL